MRAEGEGSAPETARLHGHDSCYTAMTPASDEPQPCDLTHPWYSPVTRKEPRTGFFGLTDSVTLREREWEDC